MHRIIERLALGLTASFVLLALTQPPTTSIVVAGIAALALTAVLSARYASRVIRSRELAVGARAREHRQSLVGMPEPQHPRTAGRPRTRAPSRAITAA